MQIAVRLTDDSDRFARTLEIRRCRDNTGTGLRQPLRRNGTFDWLHDGIERLQEAADRIRRFISR